MKDNPNNAASGLCEKSLKKQDADKRRLSGLARIILKKPAVNLPNARLSASYFLLFKQLLKSEEAANAIPPVSQAHQELPSIARIFCSNADEQMTNCFPDTIEQQSTTLIKTTPWVVSFAAVTP